MYVVRCPTKMDCVYEVVSHMDYEVGSRWTVGATKGLLCLLGAELLGVG